MNLSQDIKPISYLKAKAVVQDIKSYENLQNSLNLLKLREIIHKRWRIIYKIDNTKVYVLLVVDSSRNLEDILFQRLIGGK